MEWMSLHFISLLSRVVGAGRYRTVVKCSSSKSPNLLKADPVLEDNFQFESDCKIVSRRHYAPFAILEKFFVPYCHSYAA